MNTVSSLHNLSRHSLSPVAVKSRSFETAGPTDSVEIGHTNQDFVPPNLQKVLSATGRPYYDVEADTAAKTEYYKSIDISSENLFEELGGLVSRTHTETLSFDPRKYLHPWVDLRPNLRLASIYDADPVATDAPIHVTKRGDFKQKHRIKVEGRVRADGTKGPKRWKNQKTDFYEQSQKWGEALTKGGADALKIAENIALIEGYKFYNAEHSVPQFVFDREKKAKGDLHHLFTCEAKANSIRQHYRFAEVEQSPTTQKGQGWVAKETEQFEPEAGKGAVARATLYFLLHYPGKLGDKPGEYTAKDLETLVKWHKEDPVGLYELHRNQAIQEIQGNRNPLIDFPDLVDKIDFTKGLGEWGRNIKD